MIEFPSLFNEQEPEEDRPGYSSDLGEAGRIGSSMGSISYQYDKANDNYVVDIAFIRGGSAEYVLDADTVLDFDSGGGTYYNQSIRGQM